jgi:hypothetical protein
MKPLPVTCETVDVATGKVEKRETVKFGIMPPKPGMLATRPRIGTSTVSAGYSLPLRSTGSLASKG